MNMLTVDGRLIELDQDGYLKNLADWSQPVAEA
ncbi:MAG TPA: sulfurtransferase TusE, partial [Pseudomonas sp.]|nr:sulfurtransferase TusE [Pseudomonas sp.]